MNETSVMIIALIIASALVTGICAICGYRMGRAFADHKRCTDYRRGYLAGRREGDALSLYIGEIREELKWFRHRAKQDGGKLSREEVDLLIRCLRDTLTKEQQDMRKLREEEKKEVKE